MVEPTNEQMNEWDEKVMEKRHHEWIFLQVNQKGSFYFGLGGFAMEEKKKDFLALYLLAG